MTGNQVPDLPPITNRRILKIALPIVLSNATVPLLGAVDTAVIGRLGDPVALAAIGMGAIILATFYWFFGFLRLTSSGLTAQARGRGDQAEVTACLIRAVGLGLMAGLFLVLLQGVLFSLALRVSPAESAVEAITLQYLQIRIWGAPATIALYGVTGWLIALERTRAVLVLQLWQNGLNIGLSIWFVLGLGWGVPGVALGTLIAEWSGLGLGFWLARGALANLAGALAMLCDRTAIRLLLTASRDMFGRTLLLQASFTTFVMLGAGFGTVTLAANHVLMQFLEITAYALDGFAFAAEALIGQAIGARSVNATRTANRMAHKWGLIGGVAMALFFLIAGGLIIDLLTTSSEVRAEARIYLPWLILVPLLGVSSWIWDGVFIGAMKSGLMLGTMAVSVAIYGVLLAILIPVFGNHGLWAAMLGLFVARGLTMWKVWPRVLGAASGT
jgi:MATE family multidrug resistance protein